MSDGSADPLAAPGESAADLLRALQRLHAEGKIEIRVEPKRLNHLDSPVAVEADSNIWIYGFLAVAALAGWQWGLVAAAAALGLGILVYLTLGKAYIHRRIERRVRERALSNLETWRKLWRLSGLTLVAAGQGVAPCASPEGNWMGFVRSLR
jgi:hypothetical protein